ncbi:MAG: HEAT repeat domain-containing protein, partial [Planctomycetaceae bacterium]
PILTGLGRGLGGTLEPALAAASDRDRRRLAAVFASEAAIAGDSDSPVPLRIEAVQIVALSERSYALPTLLDLASADDQAVRLAAVEALGKFRGDDRIAPALLDGFEAQTPAVRSAILTALLADPGRAMQVIDAVEAGEVSAAELGAARINAFSKHRDAAVRERAKTVFVPPADRQKVLAEYSKVHGMTADANRGKAIFEKHCATCHRIAGFGTQVGPDIADSRTRTPEALLTDVLDPNRAIDGRYVAFSVVLKDGTVQTGLIVSETANAVTLAQPEGKSLTLLRDQIDLLHSDGVSLMPVGLEKSIPPQDMADLISFIKNWRYLDGAVPLAE